MNIVILSGYLGQDVFYGKSQQGNSYASIQLGTRVPHGAGKEAGTLWDRVVCFAGLADGLKAAVTKGDKVVVRGRLTEPRMYYSKAQDATVAENQIIAEEIEWYKASGEPAGKQTIPVPAEEVEDDNPLF